MTNKEINEISFILCTDNSKKELQTYLMDNIKKNNEKRWQRSKFEKECIVNDIDDVLNGEWFVWNNKTVHREFLLNQQVTTLLHWINGKSVYKLRRKSNEKKQQMCNI